MYIRSYTSHTEVVNKIYCLTVSPMRQHEKYLFWLLNRSSDFHAVLTIGLRNQSSLCRPLRA